jgi:hypothetical protein
MDQFRVERFRDLLASLRSALRSGEGVLMPQAAVAPDYPRVLAGLTQFVDGVERVDLRTPALAPVEHRGFGDQGQVDAFRRILDSIQVALHRDLPAKLGADKLAVLRQYLQLPAPSVLDVFDKSTDENAHSDVLRWLLDPNKAPVIAPAALCGIVNMLDDPPNWRKRILDAISDQCLSVRRERVLAKEGGASDDKDRIDLLISGPDFIIALENKIGSPEHEGQTADYWAWLERRRPLHTAGIFLTPLGLPPRCLQFKRMSYFDMLVCLLEGPLQGGVKPREGVVLAGYLKTLADHVLGFELRSLAADLIGGAR